MKEFAIIKKNQTEIWTEESDEAKNARKQISTGTNQMEERISDLEARNTAIT